MAREAKIGLLVVAALAILMATVLSLSQDTHFWERRVSYSVHFARTNGLQEGGLVSLSGVPIGSVDGLEFPTDPVAHYIIVNLNVRSGFASRIRENTLASIGTIGLLGDRYIELTPSLEDAPPLPAGSIIQSVDPIDVESVLGRSGDIVANVVELTASLKDVLQTIQKGEGLLGAMVRNREFGDQTLHDLQRSLANVQTTSDRLAQVLTRIERGEGLLGQLTRDTPQSRALLGDATKAAASLRSFAAQLERDRGTIGRLVRDEAYANRVLGNLDRTLQEVSEASAKLNRGDGTLGRLLNDPALYQDARGLVGSVKKSWLYRLSQGFSGLWPFGRDDPPPADPLADPTLPPVAPSP